MTDQQVYTNVYCVICNEPVELIDVVREYGNSYHKQCLKDAKGSCGQATTNQTQTKLK